MSEFIRLPSGMFLNLSMITMVDQESENRIAVHFGDFKRCEKFFGRDAEVILRRVQQRVLQNAREDMI